MGCDAILWDDAEVAELADAPALGAGGRKAVGVRVPSSAEIFPETTTAGCDAAVEYDQCLHAFSWFWLSGVLSTRIRRRVANVRVVDARRRLAYTGNSTAVNASRTSLPHFRIRNRREAD